jgi:hypothetical protein
MNYEQEKEKALSDGMSVQSNFSEVLRVFRKIAGEGYNRETASLLTIAYMINKKEIGT